MEIIAKITVNSGKTLGPATVRAVILVSSSGMPVAIHC